MMLIIGFIVGAVITAIFFYYVLLKDKTKEIEAVKGKYNDISKQFIGKEKECEYLQKKQDEDKKTLSIYFKNLANEILEEKSKKFTEQNQTNLSVLLTPLKEQIQNFEQKIEVTNKEGREKHGELKEQIKNLLSLNQQMTQEAENLTKALKGDSKVQGDWGELQLEKILEFTGLQKYIHYEIQPSFKDEYGKNLRPDVTIKLPDNKNIVIDSKVSLTHYEGYISASNDVDKATYITQHLNSINNHINDLSKKNYQNLVDNSPDFVLLFIPIESAFILAVQHDLNIYNKAFEKNIIIVTPSTLIGILRTIAHIWKQEQQSQNAQEIAKQGGALYDKFVAFIENLKKIGEKLQSTTTEYDSAMNKLTEGRGNLIKRAEKLKKLGVKSNKELDAKLIDKTATS